MASLALRAPLPQALSPATGERRHALVAGGARPAHPFGNTVHRDFRQATSAPEPRERTGGAIDGLVCAVRTGGTPAGEGSGSRG